VKNKVTDRFKAAVNRELLLKEDVSLVRVVVGSALSTFSSMSQKLEITTGNGLLMTQRLADG